jgi:hypothetical protein
LNTNPAKFLETSGDDAKDKLSLLLGKECQRVLSARKSKYRKLKKL